MPDAKKATNHLEPRMTLRIHNDLIQGSDEWLAARRGMVTASSVGNLLTTRKLTAAEFDCPACRASAGETCVSLRGGGEIKTMHPDRTQLAREAAITVIEPAETDSSRNLTLLLAAERITGWTDPIFISDDMMRGMDDEPKARAKYAEYFAPVEQAGLMVEDKWGFQIGYSPDGLVGDDGLIEIKSRRSKIHLATILADEVPAENYAQLQCGLLVSGRKWIDYVSYCGGMPLYVKRVFPDAKWADAILQAVERFEKDVAEIVRIYKESTTNLAMTEREPEYSNTELKL